MNTEPECVDCKALAKERETLIEQLALHEFDHDKKRLERIAAGGITLAVETYVLSRERAIRERAEATITARLKKRTRKKPRKARRKRTS